MYNPAIHSSSEQHVSDRTTPLRVQFVITSLPVGGAEVLLSNLIRRMDRRAFSPEVVCLKQAGELGSEIAREIPLHSNLLASKWDMRILPRLTKLFKERQTDAVVTIGAGDKMFWGRLAAKLAGVPVICSALHSTGWPDGVGRMNRMLTSITHGFIACAAGHAEYLKTSEKFPADRVFMIPNGVDTERFRPDHTHRDTLRQAIGASPDSGVVGIVAALRAEKNHEQFVSAAVEILSRRPNTHFVIVGDGPRRESIEQQISTLGLDDRVHLLGSRSDTPELLAGMDVFCLTSRNEANPVSILEALSSGVPVVAPDVGSIRETVMPGRTGILTTPLCPQSTADAITQLLEHSQVARNLGLTGRQVVRQDWSLEAMVGGYEHVLSHLYSLNASRNGSPSREIPLVPTNSSVSTEPASRPKSPAASDEIAAMTATALAPPLSTMSTTSAVPSRL